VSWDSEFFSLPPVHADLRPVQAGGPPIWIGGASEAAMRRVGRSATGWLGHEYLPDETAFFVSEAEPQAAGYLGEGGDPALSRSHLAALAGFLVVQRCSSADLT